MDISRFQKKYLSMRRMTSNVVALAFVFTLGVAPHVSAQSKFQGASIAVEADAFSFFLKGYSGILNLSLRNGFQVAFGSGRYDVPSFLLEGDANYDTAKWKATATSLQVLRVGYRFKGPMKNGPAVAAIVLNQNWRLRSETLGGETRFRPVSVGISGGYYFHIGEHFYVYPTAAYTYNNVHSGSTSVGGVPYTVEKWGPNASAHIGWEWGLN
jgi:hypothetical protein